MIVRAMSKRWLGVVVSSTDLSAVDATIDVDYVINADMTWPLQKGARWQAYSLMFERVRDYLQEAAIDAVVLKGSAVSMGGTTLAHLEAAELRGVVQAAAVAANAKVIVIQQNALSRNFGSRKADEYIKDDSFWAAKPIKGEKVRKASRAALLLMIYENER